MFSSSVCSIANFDSQHNKTNKQSVTIIQLVNGQNSSRPFLHLSEPHIALPNFGSLIKATPFQKDAARRSLKASRSDVGSNSTVESDNNCSLISIEKKNKSLKDNNNLADQKLRNGTKTRFLKYAKSCPLPIVEEETP